MTRGLLTALSLVLLLNCAGEKGDAAAAAPAQAPAVAVTPSDLSLEQVLERHAAALGGRDRLLAVKTVRMSGRMTTSKDIEGAPITVAKKRDGGKYLRRLVTGGATVIQAVDAGQVWEVDPGMGAPTPRILEGVHARRYRHRTAIEGPLVDPAAKGYKVELLGKQAIDGADAYRLRVDYGDGDVAYFLLDAKTYLLSRVVDVIQQPGGQGTLEVTTHLRDYRDAGGVKWPFEEETVLPNFNQRIGWEKVEVDVPIADDGFRMAA